MNVTAIKRVCFVGIGNMGWPMAARFGLDLMVKDLSIALDVGRDHAAPTPFAALCREMWASASTMLGKGQDHTAIAKLSETLAGVTLGEKKKTSS